MELEAGKLKAIDLYSGVGGWSLGLRLAGIEVVQAFEWWPLACGTYEANLGHAPTCVDIRKLTAKDLPEPGSIDLVVGSPPCTEFSFANRGGNGDLSDGLVDVRKFLEIVAYLKPKFWVMENVPRLASIVATEIGAKGALAKYRDIIEVNEVFSTEDFGVPQRRLRCLLGRFPVELLRSYKGAYPAPTLSSMLACFSTDQVIDPVFGRTYRADDVTDNLKEAWLTEEEAQLNRAAKCLHPVYNAMSFPDRLDRTCRTVTATCTRVSRESIVIKGDEGYRRLTLRERASVQSFPVSYQFIADSHSQRQKMIGNAIPPLFAFQVASALMETDVANMPALHELDVSGATLIVSNESAKPDRHVSGLRRGRKFRFTIPDLRFGSGLRFELSNTESEEGFYWNIDFYYGSSKNICKPEIKSSAIADALLKNGLATILPLCLNSLQPLLIQTKEMDRNDLQLTWTKKKTGASPLILLQALGRVTGELKRITATANNESIIKVLQALFPGLNRRLLHSEGESILAGAILSSVFNNHSGLSGPYTPVAPSQRVDMIQPPLLEIA